MLYEQEANNHNMLWFKIEKLLKERKMNQSQLARKADVNKTVVSALKNGKINKPSFELMCKIADALEVSLDDLRPREDE